ncbi:DUF692 domain-containing protein [Sulfuriflexus mobilis]|uniref:DUF692 domain-containing protein n=1 Tax=Sulfuriflexus mobilis TaxID=1811807 RepID=UPI000F81F9A7|nr:DUF692 family multinuclear iron-containing protein [Sulfuriflexus mobilis]
MTRTLPELGVGIVYIPGLEPLLEPGSTCVDFLEIEPQTLWQYQPGGELSYVLPDYTLRHLQALPQRKLVHSVGNALGGTHQPDTAFAAALAATIQTLDAPWASEHLSITQVSSAQAGFHTSFMLPSLQTPEGVNVAAATIRRLSEQLPVPLAVETGVNYLQPRADDMPDGEFFAAAVEAADCGIVLDLHNIWTNEQNGRQSARDFLASIPLERVWEVHLGGGFEHEGYWLDAHSGAVPGPVLALTEEILPYLPHVKAITYEIFPAFIPLFGLEAIQAQLQDIHSLWSTRHTSTPPPAYIRTAATHVVSTPQHKANPITPVLWEQTLGELVTHGEITGPLAEQLRQDPGIELMQKLIWKFRAGAIVKNLGTLTRLIMIHAGDSHLETLLDGYFRQTKPRAFASEECNGFLCYLHKAALTVPYLEDIIRFEEASMQALATQENQYIHFRYDPRALLEAILRGELPDHLESGAYELEIPPPAIAEVDAMHQGKVPRE